MKWLTKIVDEITLKHPRGEILIESGGSPSGSHHLGHLRELITADAVLLEIKKRGRQAKHIYFVDDLDALRRIPVNIPSEYKKYLGVSLCNIPAPNESEDSYADFFIKELVDAASILSIEMEFIRSHKRYKEGFFVPAIEKALQKSKVIRQTLEDVSGHKLEVNWSPIQINEDGYLKKRPFIGINTKKKEITYKDKDNNDQQVSYIAGDVKLDWRVDWPARWWLMDVAVEPFGRDHATKGGSYDTGVALSKEVFSAKPPMPMPYDFINLVGDTKKMSGSKGTGLSAREVIDILPPEITRYFILRYSPSKRLYFDPENGVAQLIDEFAELLAKQNRSQNEEQLVEISLSELEPVISSIPFSNLVTSYQAALRDPEKTLEIISRTSNSSAVSKQKPIILKELKYIENWLDNWAPEEIKFSVVKGIDEVIKGYNFSNPQKKFLSNLANLIEQKNPSESDGEWFHKAIYSIKEEHNLSTKDIFEAIYFSLIGKPSGPRAGWFLSILPRDWLIKRLKLES